MPCIVECVSRCALCLQSLRRTVVRRGRHAVAVSLAACALSAGNAHAEPAAHDSWFADTGGYRYDFHEVYAPWFGPRRGPSHPWRAALEVAGVLAVETALYWANHSANEDDWDDPAIVDKLRLRAICFDNNLSTINHIMHPIGGAASYGFSRVNRLSVPVSFAYVTAASAVWEFGIEWREQASINDLVFTPFAGMAIGEFLFHVGDYVNSAPGGGGFAQRLAANTLGIVHRTHDRIDGRGPPQPTLSADALGFSSAYFHRFGAGYGLAAIENDERRVSTMHELELTAMLVAMPGFRRLGVFRTLFQHGNFTDARLRIGFADGRHGETDIWVSSVLAGWYTQSFQRPAAGLDGHAAMFGVNTAFRFRDLHLLGRRDHYAIAHLLGPAADLWMDGGGLALHLGAGATADFAAIHPLAFETWTEQFGEGGTKSVLREQGYSFNWGMSGRVNMSITYALFEMGGKAEFGRYGSIEGHDRDQDETARDVHTVDTIADHEVWIALHPPVPARVRLSFERLARSGTMSPFSVSRFDQRLMLQAEYVF